MGSSYSGKYSNTLGAKNEGTKTKNIGHKLTKDVIAWAAKKAKSLSKKERKMFTTACVAVDTETGKEYFGRNKGIFLEKQSKNSLLFGRNGLLPKSSLNDFPLGNCAEVDAINRALNAGVKIGSIQIKIIRTTKNHFGNNIRSCKNCTHAFKGKIKRNYSGWHPDEEE